MAKISQSELELLPENLLKEAIEALQFGLSFNNEYSENGETGF